MLLLFNRKKSFLNASYLYIAYIKLKGINFTPYNTKSLSPLVEQLFKDDHDNSKY